jgi:hypothetical protein
MATSSDGLSLRSSAKHSSSASLSITTGKPGRSVGKPVERKSVVAWVGKSPKPLELPHETDVERLSKSAIRINFDDSIAGEVEDSLDASRVVWQED